MMQLFQLVIGLFIVGVSPAPMSGSRSIKTNSGAQYNPVDRLAQYGYMKGTPGKIGDVDPAELSTSVSRLQHFAGLPVTGELNNATLALLESDRCGMKDFSRQLFPEGGNPLARYNHQGTKWKKLDLTYKILNYTEDLPRNQQRRIFRTAFNLWQAASVLTMTDVTGQSISNDQVDILISFSRRTHNDPYFFDGPGGTLAHAFYPHSNSGLSGDAHFDDDERFTTGKSDGINLDWVAVHEFGHSIGLEHSGVRESIMYPWYKGYKQNIQLTSDDIQGIRALYGERPAVVRTDAMTQTPDEVTTEATTTAAASTQVVTKEPLPTADICKVDSFDTFFDGADGKTYVVSGANYWIIRKPRAGILSGPHLLRDTFPGIQTPVDAAFSKNGKTFFFKGSRYWQYRSVSSGTYVAEKTDIPMSEYDLTSSLNDVEAAFVYRNNKIYFFKGNNYWKYDETNRKPYAGYPRRISRGWRGMTGPVDAVLTWKSNGASYFFKAADYLRIQRYRHQVIRGYPHNVAQRWIKCEGNGGRMEDSAEP